MVPQKKLTQAALDFMTTEARETLDAFGHDGQTHMLSDLEEERLAASYRAALRVILGEYCAIPEQAGPQVKDFLLKLPNKPGEAQNAVIGLEIIRQTVNTLRQLVVEDEELAKQARDRTPKVDLSAAKDGGLSSADLDREISKSATPDKATDADVAKSAWGDVQKVDKAIEKSAQDNPYGELRKPKQKPAHMTFQQYIADRIPNVASLNPALAFRRSTVELVGGIMQISLGYETARMQPLFESDLVRVEYVQDLVDKSMILVRRLEAPGTERQEGLRPE